MKDSGIEWIGEIPEGWEVKPLKSLFFFGKGLPITKENLIEKGVPVISYGQIHSKSNPGTRLQQDLYRYVDKSYLQTGSNSLVHQGDFIFADTSEDLEGCGNCVYVDNETELFAGYHTVVLQKKESENNKYLSFLFKTDEWRKQIREKLVEVKLYSITRKVLKTTTVILPPEETQQKIANYLDEKCSQIEQTIQNQQQVIEKLKAYKQSLITEAVTGKVKIQNGKVAGKYEQYKDSGVEWIGEIPSGWEVRKTKYVTTKITDGAHISPETENGIYDFISTTDVKTGFIDFEHCLKTSEKSYEYFVSTGCKPQRGDVLISKDGTVGKTVIITEDRDFVIASSLVILRPNFEVISSEFLNYALQSSIVQETLLMLMHGSGLKRVSVKKNSNLLILLPTINEQNSIVIYLDKTCAAIDSAIEQKQKLIEKLTEYKKSLIYECVTGKKEV